MLEEGFLVTQKNTDRSTVIPTQSDEIARVRDILFGSNMREYERRFRTIEDELARHKQSLDELWQRLDALEGQVEENRRQVLAELRKQIDQLYDRLQARIGQLEEDTVAKVTLGDLLIEMGSRMKGGSVTESLEGLLEQHE